MSGLCYHTSETYAHTLPTADLGCRTSAAYINAAEMRLHRRLTAVKAVTVTKFELHRWLRCTRLHAFQQPVSIIHRVTSEHDTRQRVNVVQLNTPIGTPSNGVALTV